MNAWGHLLFRFQTSFLQCLSNYSHWRGFGAIAVFTPGLNGISKAETSSSSILFCSHFHIHHLPSYIAIPFWRDFKRTMGTQHKCGHDLFYTVLINYNSFSHNKRCRRSNYSVKDICSQGKATACYQPDQKELRTTLWEMTVLLSKISHFYVISTKMMSNTKCTQSQTHSPALCQSLHVI